MKMTRLEWAYLQKIALDHPYYDTHRPPLSDAEAKAIVEANITMTGREFVDSVYAKLGMTRPEAKRERFAWLRSMGELLSVPPIRRIAIVVLVVVLMTVFFAATPVGRAFAESVIQYIATLFEDGSLTIYRSDTANIPYVVKQSAHAVNDTWEWIESKTDYTYVQSFDAFTKITNRKPLVLPLPCTNLYYVYDEEFDYLLLFAIYDTKDGKIITYQIWNADSLITYTSAGYKVYVSDPSIYFSIEEEEGLSHIKIVLDDSVVTVSYSGSYTVEEIIEMLK